MIAGRPRPAEGSQPGDALRAWTVEALRIGATPIGIVAWFVLIVHLWVLLAPHFHPPPSPRRWNDALVYVQAASSALKNPGHLYDAAVLQLTRPRAVRAFIYPPGALLPFLGLVPLASSGGAWLAAAVWAVIDAMALFAALTLLARRFQLSWPVIGCLLAFISFTRPIWWELGSGQVNGLVLLLIAVAMSDLRAARSGVGLGLALAVKPIAPVVLLVPLLRRRLSPVLVGLACFLVMNAIFVPLIGLHGVMTYLTQVLPFFSHYVIHDRSNVSLPNVFQSFLGTGPLSRRAAFSHPVPDTGIAVAALWLVRAAICLVALVIVLTRRINIEMAFVLVLATVPALAATVWPHYFVLVLPLALALFAARPAGMIIAVGGLLLMLVFGPLSVLWLSWLVLWPAAAFLWLQMDRSTSAFAAAAEVPPALSQGPRGGAE